MSTFRTRIAVFVAAMLALSLVPLTGTAAASSATSQVWVTHGLPLDDEGTLVDVVVNGDVVVPEFAFGTTVGPLDLPADTYSIEVRLAGTDTVAIAQDVTVPAGGNFSVVAGYTDSDGTIGLNVFANDVRRTTFLSGRLALHHSAAAPAVDIDLGLFPLSRFLPFLVTTKVADATNGAQANIDAFSFLAYTADVRLAGTKTVVLSLDDVRVPPRTLTNVYVVGSAADGTLQVITSAIRA